MRPTPPRRPRARGATGGPRGHGTASCGPPGQLMGWCLAYPSPRLRPPPSPVPLPPGYRPAAAPLVLTVGASNDARVPAIPEPLPLSRSRTPPARTRLDPPNGQIRVRADTSRSAGARVTRLGAPIDARVPAKPDPLPLSRSRTTPARTRLDLPNGQIRVRADTSRSAGARGTRLPATLAISDPKFSGLTGHLPAGCWHRVTGPGS